MSEPAIRLLVGTTKGAFVLDGDPDRTTWTVRGPFCDGWPVNHVLGDPVTGTMWAAGGGDWTGAGVWRSTDGSGTWSLARLTTGQVDEWAATDPDVAATIVWRTSPAAPGPHSGAEGWSVSPLTSDHVAPSSSLTRRAAGLVPA